MPNPDAATLKQKAHELIDHLPDGAPGAMSLTRRQC